jgi:predicted permease
VAAFLHDLRYGIRTLARSPGFTLIATVVLALGIGVNATVFSLTNAFFLRPLPVSDPETIVRVYSNRVSNTRYPTYVELRDRNSTLSVLAAFQLRSFGLRLGAENEHAFGEIVSGNYFDLVGVNAVAGRLLAPEDDRPGAPPVVVLSHAFWKGRLGGALDAVGRTISLNGQPFTVVGIAPKTFTGILAPLVGAFWVPNATDSVLRPSLDPAARLESQTFHLAGRLKPGVDRGHAQADLDTIARQLRAAAGRPGDGQAVSVYGSTMLHPEISQPITVFTSVLMVVVALVLMIVCVNVANLVLARAAGRDVELAVRQSLGAGRGRLIRQLLTESLILSAIGAAGGLGIAYWTTRLAASAELPVPVPIALDLSLDVRVLAFTTLAAVGTTLLFGMAPAFAASRSDLVRVLKGAGSGAPRHGRLRSVFLVAQVSMSVLLLIVAGLAVRSVRNAHSIDTGFDTGRVLSASIDLETGGYSAARGREFIRSLTERLDAAPGVESANLVDVVPLTLSNTTTYLLRSSDPPPQPGLQPATPQIYTNAVAPGHFKTLRIGMLAGRDFTHADGHNARQVAIVNETLARRFWPGAPAVGQRLRSLEASTPEIEVVGVVRDSKYVTVGEEPRPFLYRPLAQQYVPQMSILVRAAGSSDSTLAILKQELNALDSRLALFNVASLDDAISVSLLPVRIAGGLLGVVGLGALALAALGVYGVLSFLVRSRTREIGVRIALGATPRAVAALVVRQALVWTATGAAIGMVLAWIATRFLSSLLYGISPTDPLTFGGVALLLASVAVAAALFPAVRASRLDPLSALRSL